MRKAPRGPRYSNCLFWAAARWWRRGGYIAMRQSSHFRFLPHFLWSSSGRFWWGYSPEHPREGKRAMLHGIRFAGAVQIEKGR